LVLDAINYYLLIISLCYSVNQLLFSRQHSPLSVNPNFS